MFSKFLPRSATTDRHNDVASCCSSLTSAPSVPRKGLRSALSVFNRQKNSAMKADEDDRGFVLIEYDDDDNESDIATQESDSEPEVTRFADFAAYHDMYKLSGHNGPVLPGPDTTLGHPPNKPTRMEPWYPSDLGIGHPSVPFRRGFVDPSVKNISEVPSADNQLPVQMEDTVLVHNGNELKSASLEPPPRVYARFYYDEDEETLCNGDSDSWSNTTAGATNGDSNPGSLLDINGETLETEESNREEDFEEEKLKEYAEQYQAIYKLPDGFVIPYKSGDITLEHPPSGPKKPWHPPAKESNEDDEEARFRAYAEYYQAIYTLPKGFIIPYKSGPVTLGHPPYGPKKPWYPPGLWPGCH